MSWEKYGWSVFENTALRRIFRSKREEVTMDWRQLHNDELHNLYTSPNIRPIMMVKSRSLKWAGHVELTEKR
jgi:hypothetical protein